MKTSDSSHKDFRLQFQRVSTYDLKLAAADEPRLGELTVIVRIVEPKRRMEKPQKDYQRMRNVVKTSIMCNDV